VPFCSWSPQLGESGAAGATRIASSEGSLHPKEPTVAARTAYQAMEAMPRTRIAHRASRIDERPGGIIVF
jgi:hypothetical protein